MMSVVATGQLFWLVYYIFHKLNIEGDFKDIIICLVVVSCSLIDRLTPLKLTLIWPTESLGFAYGIILFHYLDRLKKWSGEGWLAKSGYLILLGGITGSAYLKFKTVEFWGDYCLKIFLGIVLLTLMLHLTVRIIIGNKVNIFLGEISYEMFLLHGVIFGIVEYCFKKSSSGVFVWLSVIITIAFASVIHCLCRFLLGLCGKGLKKIVN